MGDPQDLLANKLKKPYRKPESNTLDPQAAIEKLKPLALAGDEDAQRLIEAIRDKHGLGGGSQK